MGVSKAHILLEEAEVHPQGCLISEHWSQYFASVQTEMFLQLIYVEYLTRFHQFSIQNYYIL